jgi:hypothetical protein
MRLKSEFSSGDITKVSVVRVAKGAIRFILLYPLSILDNLSARKKSHILTVIENQDFIDGLPTLIYVHYSSRNILSSNEKKTLSQLKKMGFQICLVINLNPKYSFDVDAFTGNSDLFNSLFLRSNIGYDLGAYRDIYFFLKDKKGGKNHQILFMNNSVVWFPEMISRYFKKLQDLKSDVYAASISDQYVKHIQTFLFGANTELGVEAIEKWLKTIKNWRLKKSIVSRGELGTNDILNEDLTFEAFPSQTLIQEIAIEKIQQHNENEDSLISLTTIDRLRSNRNFAFAGLPINPSHQYWLEMLDCGFPGIKIDLIKKNPTQVADYEYIISKLIDAQYPMAEYIELVNSNLNRSLIMRIRTFLKW